MGKKLKNLVESTSGNVQFNIVICGKITILHADLTRFLIFFYIKTLHQKHFNQLIHRGDSCNFTSQTTFLNICR